MKEFVSSEEAIKEVMKITGKTYRQARAALIQAVRAGKVRARDAKTLEVVPPDKVINEH